MAARTATDATSLSGTQITFVAAAASDTIAGGPGVHLRVNNGGGVPCVVTLVTPETVEGALGVDDRTVSVTNAQIWDIPIPARYNVPATGLATVNFSQTATVTVAYVRANTA